MNASIALVMCRRSSVASSAYPLFPRRKDGNEPAMSDLRPPTPVELATSGDDLHCRYCDAPLDPTYYFCRRCATPYKDVASVLTPVRAMRPSAGELVKLHAPNVSRVWWTYFCVIFGVSLLLFVTAGQQRLGMHIIVTDLAVLITTAVFAVRYWPLLRTQLARTGFGGRYAYIGLALLVPMLALNFGYHEFLQSLDGVGGSSWVAQLSSDGLSDAALVLLICVFPAINEEIAFRGLVQTWLMSALRPARAIALGAVLFSAMHFSILRAPYLFLVGYLLGWIRMKTGSLYPAMLAHFLHNLAVLMIDRA